MICRPGGRDDVPFRSVASRIIKGLTDEAREHFQLDVLRPPTFEQLSKVLHEAKANGKPYHIVHFDGHGLYADAATGRRGFQSLSCSSAMTAPASTAILLFENPTAAKTTSNRSAGRNWANCWSKRETPVLVLNACRSAHADASPVMPRHSRIEGGER